VKRTPKIDGLDADEYIRRNADPIWLHQNEMWEYITEHQEMMEGPEACEEKQALDEDGLLPFWRGKLPTIHWCGRKGVLCLLGEPLAGRQEVPHAAQFHVMSKRQEYIQITMEISVILAHPDKASFNHAIASIVVEQLEANGNDVFFHDLYAKTTNLSAGERFGIWPWKRKNRTKVCTGSPIARSSRSAFDYRICMNDEAHLKELHNGRQGREKG
jgi:hypothetical protein